MSNKENYLDFVFELSDKVKLVVLEDGDTAIQMENKGVFNRLAQKFLKKPKYTYIHLEELGTIVLNQIDGTHSVYEIGQEVSRVMGEKAEPLYERLVTYMRQLQSYGFIKVK